MIQRNACAAVWKCEGASRGEIFAHARLIGSKCTIQNELRPPVTLLWLHACTMRIATHACCFASFPTVSESCCRVGMGFYSVPGDADFVFMRWKREARSSLNARVIIKPQDQDGNRCFSIISQHKHWLSVYAGNLLIDPFLCSKNTEQSPAFEQEWNPQLAVHSTSSPHNRIPTHRE